MKRSDTLKMRLACRKTTKKNYYSDLELYMYLNKFAVHARKEPKLLGTPRRAVSTNVIKWMKKNVKNVSWKK